MYGIYANIWGILMVNVTIYSSTMDPMGMEITINPAARIGSLRATPMRWILRTCDSTATTFSGNSIRAWTTSKAVPWIFSEFLVGFGVGF